MYNEGFFFQCKRVMVFTLFLTFFNGKSSSNTHNFASMSTYICLFLFLSCCYFLKVIICLILTSKMVVFLCCYRYDENRHKNHSCLYNQNKAYVVFSAMGSFFVPLVVVVYVYFKISCVIAERHNKLEALNGPKLKVRTI